MFDIFSHKNVILEADVKDAKMGSFSSDFQNTHLKNIHFICIFFMNFSWTWDRLTLKDPIRQSDV